MTRPGRNLVRIFAALAFLVMLLCGGVVFPAEVVVYLLCGWCLYLKRVVPEISVDWIEVCFSCVILLVFAVGLHCFLRWLASVAATSAGPGEAPLEAQILTGRIHWQRRWTASVVAAALLMFVAGICVTGVAHQLAWLVRSPEPFLAIDFEAGVRTQSQNNGRQIALAIRSFAEEQGTLPPGGTMSDDGKLRHGWLAFLLPYIEEQSLYDRIDFELPWDHPRNREAVQSAVYAYQGRWSRRHGESQVSEGGYWLTDFASNVHVVGGTRRRSLGDISDGESNTILFGEAFSRRKPWGHVANWRDPAQGVNKSPEGFGAPWSSGGAHFSFVDGSTRFISENVDPEVLRALSTPDGGEKVSED